MSASNELRELLSDKNEGVIKTGADTYWKSEDEYWTSNVTLGRRRSSQSEYERAKELKQGEDAGGTIVMDMATGRRKVVDKKGNDFKMPVDTGVKSSRTAPIGSSKAAAQYAKDLEAVKNDPEAARELADKLTDNLNTAHRKMKAAKTDSDREVWKREKEVLAKAIADLDEIGGTWQQPKRHGLVRPGHEPMRGKYLGGPKGISHKFRR